MTSARPLIDASYAQSELDVDEDQLVELLEEGLIAPCFSISAAPSRRRELRILQAGVIYYAATQRPLPCNLEEVISDLIPVDSPLTVQTFRRTLNCSASLIYALLAARLIALAPGEIPKPGPGGCPRLDRKSCLGFLTLRVV